MSWDILLMPVPAGFRSVRDIPSDWQPLPLGPRSEVVAGISAVRPDIDWSDPTWGMLGGEGFSIEFSTGREDPVQSVMLHVRGGGDVIPLIAEICERNRWRAIDCSSGEFMDFGEESAQSWRDWQAYRDRVVGRTGETPTEEPE